MSDEASDILAQLRLAGTGYLALLLVPKFMTLGTNELQILLYGLRSSACR